MITRLGALATLAALAASGRIAGAGAIQVVLLDLAAGPAGASQGPATAAALAADGGGATPPSWVVGLYADGEGRVQRWLGEIERQS